MYDQNSFLQGIAVGKSMKGWSAGLGASMPTCWNDEGVYTYFYIDYHLPLDALSLPLFRLSTRVMCETGEIPVNDISEYNSTTYRVYCNLRASQNGWIAVVGYNSAWVKYANRHSVPEYAYVFWVDDAQPWSSGFLADVEALPDPVRRNISEQITPTYGQTTIHEPSESFSLTVAGYSPSESVSITY